MGRALCLPAPCAKIRVESVVCRIGEWEALLWLVNIHLCLYMSIGLITKPHNTSSTPGKGREIAKQSRDIIRFWTNTWLYLACFLDEATAVPIRYWMHISKMDAIHNSWNQSLKLATLAVAGYGSNPWTDHISSILSWKLNQTSFLQTSDHYNSWPSEVSEIQQQQTADLSQFWVFLSIVGFVGLVQGPPSSEAGEKERVGPFRMGPFIKNVHIIFGIFGPPIPSECRRGIRTHGQVLNLHNQLLLQFSGSRWCSKQQTLFTSLYLQLYVVFAHATYQYNWLLISQHPSPRADVIYGWPLCRHARGWSRLARAMPHMSRLKETNVKRVGTEGIDLRWINGFESMS